MNSKRWVGALTLILLPLALAGHAQTAGSISGTVTDSNGAVVQGATVRVANAITKYSQVGSTDAHGTYRLIDLPYNSYLLTIETTGFQPATKEVAVRSNLPCRCAVR